MKSKNELIEALQENPYIKEYKRLEKILNTNESLKNEILNLQKLQQKIIKLKHEKDTVLIKDIEVEYWYKRRQLEENPIIKNYLNLQEDINHLLQTIKTILEDGLSI